MLTTKKGNPNKPPRVLIYGPEGVGKTTFGAKAENPIFITPEGGVDQVRTRNGSLVDEIEGVSTWDDVMKACADILKEPHDFRTLVVDSADWLEKLCHAKIIGDTKKSIITVNGGYGAGYRQSEIMHKELIELLSKIRETRGMAIIVTAHAHVRQVKDPSMPEDYDGYEIKCHEFVSSLWREWVDALLFVRFKTYTTSGDDTAKARAVGDTTRVVYATKQPSFQAKNRYGIDPKCQGEVFSETYFDQFISQVRRIDPAELNALDFDQIKLDICDWVTALDLATQEIVSQSVTDAKGDEKELRRIHAKLKTLTKGKIK